MSTLFQRQISKAAGAAFAAAAMIAASPAVANTSSNAAAAEMTAPVKEAAGETISMDANFRDAFSQWESLDTQGPDNPYDRTTTTDFVRSTVTVGVPSGMPLRTATLTSNYGMRTHPVLRKRRAHKGVDLAAPTGTPIYATADGIITRADWFSSYGLYISIDHGGDLETRFAHLSRLAVDAGERVKKGQLIGYVGSTGRSTGPHLHYEVRIDGVAVNPIPYMKETNVQLAYQSGNSAAAGE